MQQKISKIGWSATETVYPEEIASPARKTQIEAALVAVRLRLKLVLAIGKRLQDPSRPKECPVLKKQEKKRYAAAAKDPEVRQRVVMPLFGSTRAERMSTRVALQTDPSLQIAAQTDPIQ